MRRRASPRCARRAGGHGAAVHSERIRIGSRVGLERRPTVGIGSVYDWRLRVGGKRQRGRPWRVRIAVAQWGKEASGKRQAHGIAGPTVPDAQPLAACPPPPLPPLVHAAAIRALRICASRLPLSGSLPLPCISASLLAPASPVANQTCLSWQVRSTVPRASPALRVGRACEAARRSAAASLPASHLAEHGWAGAGAVLLGIERGLSTARRARQLLPSAGHGRSRGGAQPGAGSEAVAVRLTAARARNRNRSCSVAVSIVT